MSYPLSGRTPFTQRAGAVFLGLLLLVSTGLAAEPPVISGVSISKGTFNPSLGQKVRVSFNLTQPGALTVLLLDRDGYIVRTLVSKKPAKKGPSSFDWDGRNDRGETVADEAYSLKIDVADRVSGEKPATYFPAASTPREWSLKPKYYDSRGGVLAYTLPAACRVHIQAGTASVDKLTGKLTGPVLKTLVNREPRPVGAVIEQWNGFDDSGAVNIAALRDFMVAIATSALPENSVIAFGNRRIFFLSYASQRSGPSLLSTLTKKHEHHHGLVALDDVSPDLKLTPEHAKWSADQRLWVADTRELPVTVSLVGVSADHFSRQPAKLHVFVDGKAVKEISSPTPGMVVRVPLAAKSPQPQLVAVNWVSEYGPVAVAAARVSVGLPTNENAVLRK
jgi:hypothetical protein